MPRNLPSGTVTFLFTDVDGSTRLLQQLGPERYAEALAVHRRVLRDAFVAEGGVEVDTQGDAFLVAFPTAVGAGASARAAQRASCDEFDPSGRSLERLQAERRRRWASWS